MTCTASVMYSLQFVFLSRGIIVRSAVIIKIFIYIMFWYIKY